jgi:hypothetical protein
MAFGEFLECAALVKWEERFIGMALNSITKWNTSRKSIRPDSKSDKTTTSRFLFSRSIAA